MNIRQTLATSAIAVVGLAATTSAQAATLLSDNSAPFARAVDTSFNEAFTGAGAGPANLSFVLDGFGSLDGMNFYEDDFTLALNGVSIFSGTFNLGGGGSDMVFLQNPGATVNNISGNGTAVTWTGGAVNISTPLTLAAGANVLTFGYQSLTAGHAGFQGLGDEAWDASNIVVSQGGAVTTQLVGLVPEPASWALMLVGFGGLGGLLRLQRRPEFAPARI